MKWDGSMSEETRHRRMLWWRTGHRESYAVVASISILRGSPREWAAYLGACPHQTEVDFLDVAQYGAKLEETEARAFARGRFGLGELPYRP